MKNRFEIRGEVVAIQLERKDGKHLEALIDASDLALASRYRWHAAWDPTSSTFYVLTNIRRRGKRTSLSLHRLLMGGLTGSSSEVIDHADHDGLNNRRFNLRRCTESLNRHNPSKLVQHNSSSGYRGVQWSSRADKWIAKIRIDKKTFYLGHYLDAKVASGAVQEFLEKRGLTKWQQPRLLTTNLS